MAVFFIDLLGHWALRLFAVGFTVGSILAGGAAAVLVARATHRRAGRLAGRGLLGLAALAGYRAQPGAPSLLVYGVVVAAAAAAYASVLLGALGRLERDPVPAPASGLGRTRRSCSGPPSGRPGCWPPGSPCAGSPAGSATPAGSPGPAGRRRPGPPGAAPAAGDDPPPGRSPASPPR